MALKILPQLFLYRIIFIALSMERGKFKCKYCHGTKLRKTQGGVYACYDCGRQPDTVIWHRINNDLKILPSNMLVNDTFLKTKSTIRNRTYLAERLTGKEEKELLDKGSDLHTHLEGSNKQKRLLIIRELDKLSGIFSDCIKE